MTFFLGVADAEPLVRRSGVEFVSYGEATFPRGAIENRLRTLSGAHAHEFTIQLVVDVTRAALDEGERAITAARPDALILDAFQPGLNLVAMHLGLPFITISNALHFD
jgi:zeaxanthin glucosyltransferase